VLEDLATPYQVPRKTPTLPTQIPNEGSKAE
jgi:hypothetical protein